MWKKALDKLISHAIWAWIIASIFLVFKVIDVECWKILTIILIGGRTVEGAVQSIREEPKEN